MTEQTTRRDPTPSPAESCMEAAEYYSQLGMPMVILYGVVRGVDGQLQCECTQGTECGRPGKHPRRKRWLRDATTNIQRLRSLYATFPESNLAIATGNVVVIDLDPRHGSDESERGLRAVHGPWPETPEVATGGGGRHLYFQGGDWRVKNTLPALRGYEGVDVRGIGGYVVAPPSRHISGSIYAWAKGLDRPLAHLPEPLTVGLVRNLAAKKPPPGATAYTWAALAEEYDKVATSKPGSRNRDLFGASCRLGELVAGGDLDEGLVVSYLKNAASLCGLEESEATSTIANGLTRGARKPRSGAPAIQNREEAQEYLNHMRHVVQSLPWKGHAGKRQITVLEALIRIAMRAGGPANFARGVRGIALEAGIASLDSVIRALRELREQGWLTCLFVGDSRDRPSRWKLHIPESALQDLNEGTHPPDWGDVQTMQHPQLPVGQDAFRRQVRARWIPEWDRYLYHQGLDKTAWRILELLVRGPRPTRKSIADDLGVHPSTAGRVIKRLVDHGLVEETKEGLVATLRSPDDLDNVAVHLGTYGAARKQRAAYGWAENGVSHEMAGGVTPMRPHLPELTACPHRPQCPYGVQPCQSADSDE